MSIASLNPSGTTHSFPPVRVWRVLDTDTLDGICVTRSIPFLNADALDGVFFGHRSDQGRTIVPLTGGGETQAPQTAAPPKMCDLRTLVRSTATPNITLVPVDDLGTMEGAEFAQERTTAPRTVRLLPPILLTPPAQLVVAELVKSDTQATHAAPTIAPSRGHRWGLAAAVAAVSLLMVSVIGVTILSVIGQEPTPDAEHSLEAVLPHLNAVSKPPEVPPAKAAPQEATPVVPGPQSKPLSLDGAPLHGSPQTLASFDYAFERVSREYTTADVARLQEVLGRCGDRPLVVTGHTCATGDARVNRLIGLARGRDLGDVIAALGVAEHRLAVRSSGEEAPAFGNDTHAGRASNRRATVGCSAD